MLISMATRLTSHRLRLFLPCYSDCSSQGAFVPACYRLPLPNRTVLARLGACSIGSPSERDFPCCRARHFCLPYALCLVPPSSCAYKTTPLVPSSLSFFFSSSTHHSLSSSITAIGFDPCNPHLPLVSDSIVIVLRLFFHLSTQNNPRSSSR